MSTQWVDWVAPAAIAAVALAVLSSNNGSVSVWRWIVIPAVAIGLLLAVIYLLTRFVVWAARK